MSLLEPSVADPFSNCRATGEQSSTTSKRKRGSRVVSRFPLSSPFLHAPSLSIWFPIWQSRRRARTVRLPFLASTHLRSERGVRGVDEARGRSSFWPFEETSRRSPPPLLQAPLPASPCPALLLFRSYSPSSLVRSCPGCTSRSFRRASSDSSDLCLLLLLLPSDPSHPSLHPLSPP